MSTECTYKNPLTHDGTSQEQRLLAALRPSYVGVDERSLEDLITLVRDYAKQLNYYDSGNEIKEDWTKFIDNDISTLIAIVAKTDKDVIRTEYYDAIAADIDPAKSTLVNLLLFTSLFVKIIEIAVEMEQWNSRAVAGLGFTEELVQAIRSHLSSALRRLIAYNKGAVALSIVSGSNPDLDDPLQVLSSGGSDIVFGSDWFDRSILADLAAAAGKTIDEYIADLDWVNGYVRGTNGPDKVIPADESIYVGSDDNARMISAMRAINAEFEVFYEERSKLIANARAHLEESLEEYSEHEPHMALMLAFLLLFEFARDHLNTITKRHLDFYYKDVLRLLEEPATPDKVHILFELARNTNAHLVEEDTLLNAGKDDSGVDMVFATDEDLVVNQATVESIKTVFYDYNNNEHLYAAPIANSEDGLGAEFENPDEPKWPTFGNLGVENMPPTIPPAEIGFAVASPLLFLAEGERTIRLEFILQDPVPSSSASQSAGPGAVAARRAQFQTVTSLLTTGGVPNIDKVLERNGYQEIEGAFKIYVSGEEEWLEIKASNLSVVENTNALAIGRKSLFFEATLSRSDKPVVAYNPEILGGTFETSWPMLRVVLDQASPNYQYSSLNNLNIRSVDLSVDVREVSTVVAQNDAAVLDVSKPFQPFGPNPAIGSAFYIGSTEVFRKRLDKLDIEINWADLPTDGFADHYGAYGKDGRFYKNSFDNVTQIGISNGSFKVQAEILDKKNWVLVPEWLGTDRDRSRGLRRVKRSSQRQNQVQSSFKADLFKTASGSNTKADANRIIKLQTIGSGIGRADNLSEIEEFETTTQRGFVKLTLDQPIDFAFGHKDYPNVFTTAVIAANKGGIEPEILPNKPYTPIIESLKLHYAASVRLRFRADGRHMRTNDQLFHIFPFGQKEVNRAVEPGSVKLLPHYTDEGALYIGLKNLQPPQNLALLFQCAENTANPNRLGTADVQWSVLTGNKWQQLQSFEVLTDTTNQFLTSGIVKLAIPEEVTDDNTLLASGLHWLRASAAELSDAVCQMIDIHSQAVTATFQDNDNDLTRLRNPLAAETISKLDVARSAIKSVTQPFASFGGKVKEESLEFYTRVSERLRHKARAITIWDYERLVLEHFPDVYKVKCLNHTSQVQDPSGKIEYSEYAPGNVVLIVLSNVRNKNAVNPLQPRTSLNTLQEVKTFLSAWNSEFVKLEVINPDYEEIKMIFNVSFRTGFDEGFYQLQLQEDIKRFLTPWAFDDGVDIAFGGRIHKSVILDYVEERPYVDFVTEFVMQHKGDNVEEAVATNGKSILVSAENHKIDLYSEPGTST